MYSPPYTHIRCLNQALCNSMWSQWKILWNLYFPESSWRNLSFQFNWEQQWFPNVAPWLHQNHLEELTDIHRWPSTSPREAKAIQFEENLEICPLETLSLRCSHIVESIAIRWAELMEFLF